MIDQANRRTKPGDLMLGAARMRNEAKAWDGGRPVAQDLQHADAVEARAREALPDRLAAMISRGVQIKAARAMLGMTRADLARRAGLHPNAVKYWEARTVPTPPPYAVQAMEEALGELGVVAFTDQFAAGW